MLKISTNLADTPEEYEQLAKRLPKEYYDELNRLAKLDEPEDQVPNDH